MKPEDDGFVKPQVALQDIVHYAGSEYLAKQIIADGLRSGKIGSQARYVWETNFGDITENWVPRRFKDFLYHEDVEIENNFWRESVQWPNELSYWRWDHGDFVMFISDPSDDKLIRIYIKDIYLKRDDVKALVGRSKRSGGPKSDRERWALFWINILYEHTRDFDWTQFGSLSELRRAFLEANSHDGAFSDNNISFAVALAWEYLVKRSAGDRLRSGQSSVSDQSLSDRLT